jgi:hypothetical protein
MFITVYVKLSSKLTELYHVQHVMVEHPAQYHVVRPTQTAYFSRVSSSEPVM